ncbi:hypothetical protein D3C75_1083740 [compost metagenome]
MNIPAPHIAIIFSSCTALSVGIDDPGTTSTTSLPDRSAPLKVNASICPFSPTIDSCCSSGKWFLMSRRTFSPHILIPSSYDCTSRASLVSSCSTWSCRPPNVLFPFGVAPWLISCAPEMSSMSASSRSIAFCHPVSTVDP